MTDMSQLVKCLCAAADNYALLMSLYVFPTVC